MNYHLLMRDVDMNIKLGIHIIHLQYKLKKKI